MGIGDIQKEPEHDGSSGGSSSSSSGSSSDDETQFPEYEVRCPRILIREDEHGNAEAVTYPDTPAVACSRSWYTEEFTPDDHTPANWILAFWETSEVQNAKHKVQEVFGEDLHDLLHEDARLAAETIREAANRFSREPDKHRLEGIVRSCAVCGDDLHIVEDDTTNWDGREVCSDHTADDLASSGLLK